MDPVMAARREVALDIENLADSFAVSDERALKASRIGIWVILGIVSLVIVLLLFAGSDWRYVMATWASSATVLWGGYGLSARRQRQQTRRLRELATKWMEGNPAARS
jgi:hypothetical protein